MVDHIWLQQCGSDIIKEGTVKGHKYTPSIVSLAGVLGNRTVS